MRREMWYGLQGMVQRKRGLQERGGSFFVSQYGANFEIKDNWLVPLNFHFWLIYLVFFSN